ncbi:hypothetical protein C8R47DRAFT_1083771 [Mycena vitilis]|nr:hypothetical protein C8R47DRAFT_1083771 [Mycena vitilis]
MFLVNVSEVEHAFCSAAVDIHAHCRIPICSAMEHLSYGEESLVKQELLFESQGMCKKNDCPVRCLRGQIPVVGITQPFKAIGDKFNNPPQRHVETFYKKCLCLQQISFSKRKKVDLLLVRRRQGFDCNHQDLKFTLASKFRRISPQGEQGVQTQPNSAADHNNSGLGALICMLRPHYLLDADKAAEEYDLWTTQQATRGRHGDLRHRASSDAEATLGYRARGKSRQMHGGLCGTSAGQAQCPRRRARRGAVTGGEHAAVRNIYSVRDVQPSAHNRHRATAHAPDGRDRDEGKTEKRRKREDNVQVDNGRCAPEIWKLSQHAPPGWCAGFSSGAVRGTRPYGEKLPREVSGERALARSTLFTFNELREAVRRVKKKWQETVRYPGSIPRVCEVLRAGCSERNWRRSGRKAKRNLP